MTSRLMGSLGTLVLLAVSMPLVATMPVPRKSPELKFRDPQGKEKLLSSLNGKVVVVEFLLVACPHCLRVAHTIDKLHRDLGPRGFQPIAIAFDQGANGRLIGEYVQNFKVGFAAGYTSSADVDRFLGRAPTERLQVPQLVVIDRRGIIRAQSLPVREVNLENEKYLGSLLDALLEEKAPLAPSSRKPVARPSAAIAAASRSL